MICTFGKEYCTMRLHTYCSQRTELFALLTVEQGCNLVDCLFLSLSLVDTDFQVVVSFFLSFSFKQKQHSNILTLLKIIPVS